MVSVEGGGERREKTRLETGTHSQLQEAMLEGVVVTAQRHKHGRKHSETAHTHTRIKTCTTNKEGVIFPTSSSLFRLVFSVTRATLCDADGVGLACVYVQTYT